MSGCRRGGRGGQRQALQMVRGQGRGSAVVARRRRRHEGQDVALSNVVVGGEGGDALVDDGAGRGAVRGERGGDRVSVGEAIAWNGGRRRGGRKEGHGGRRQLVVVRIQIVCMVAQNNYLAGDGRIFLYGAARTKLGVRLCRYDIKPTQAQLTLVVSNITFTYK